MSHLEIGHLSKNFAGKEILKNIQLTVEEGEFVTILGPSGSGKSTLFHIIGGLLTPAEGSVQLDGQEITGERGHISYMPQQHSLFPWRTILQNVLLGQELTGKTDKERALDMIEKAGLAGYENELPDALSGGMKQRAAFVRALLSPQSLILLDEPFSALDDFTRQDMQEWLQSIWMKYKKTILFVTHNIEEALFLSDRIAILSTKPATVIKEFKIPFGRPRKKDLFFSSQFLDLKQEVSKWIINGVGEGEQDERNH
ncbi:MAG TPA: ABC transporter ATP-binding protein [Bacillus bacterium]|uniref:ABC transporter n=1 Tax=Siminovitchia fordii TaxID=254759 RepID=A0ABQ4K1R8_9BACI|nr:ABC transporter ATP-binding protein [Siminovitchia fordii]GIN19586.1 ABC transporter [Siminovitchia fordii]HBZ11503.1 ABC transporter ATP-binding protein [Bacillus sp. (in: firmicutes)]